MLNGQLASKERVIGVPDGGVAAAVEGGLITVVERRVELEPAREIGVSKEEPPEGHEVGVPFSHGAVPFLPPVPAAGDEGAPERLPERRQPPREPQPPPGHPRLDHVAV